MGLAHFVPLMHDDRFLHGTSWKKWATCVPPRGGSRARSLYATPPPSPPPPPGF